MLVAPAKSQQLLGLADSGLVTDVQPTYDKLIAEVPKYKMITPSVLSDRLRVSQA